MTKPCPSHDFIPQDDGSEICHRCGVTRNPSKSSVVPLPAKTADRYNEFSRDAILAVAAKQPALLPNLLTRAEKALQLCLERGWYHTAEAWQESLQLLREVCPESSAKP